MNRTFGIAQLKAFNEWRDEILIEASTLLLIAGFILGTIDIFVGGGVATAGWFKVSWAVVQALAIDGLFFAVWSRVARAKWTRASLGQNAALVGVGLVLALVAMLVNDILTYQQVNSLTDSIDAIRKLGIDVQGFTTARAVLVVAVGVLVQLFCRADGTPVNGTLAMGHPDGTPAVGQVNGTDEQVGHLGHLNGTLMNGTLGTPLNEREETVPSVNGTPASGTVEQVGHPDGTPRWDTHNGTDEQVGHPDGTLGTPTMGQRNTDKLLKTSTAHTQQEGTGQQDSAHLDRSGTPPNGTVEQVRDILKERPTISIRNLAKELGVPKTTAANWRLKALEPVEVQS